MRQLITALETHLASAGSNSRRIFHGRGHCYPGLEHINVDYHPGIIFITLYQALIENDRVLLHDFVSQHCRGFTVVEQHRYLPKSPSKILQGSLSLEEARCAQTDGMRFDIKLGANQNIGYFLDMQNTHQWLREHAEGKRILNLFSYTCAFSVAALKGGAESVVNVDMSAGVLKTGQRNHALNDVGGAKSRFMKLDIMKSWGRIKKTGPFDFLIIDPPSNQRGSFVAEKDYIKVLRRIPQLLVNGGEVLACLNAPHLPERFLLELMAEACPQCQLIERLPASKDFPESNPDCSLKVFWFKYRPVV